VAAVLVLLVAVIGVARGVGPARPLAAPVDDTAEDLIAIDSAAPGVTVPAADRPTHPRTSPTRPPRPSPSPRPAARPEVQRPEEDPVAVAAGGAHLLVVDRPYDVRVPVRAAVVPGDRLDTRVRTDLPCERVHMVGGTGVCLTLGYDPRYGSAFLFDRNFQLVRKLDASGLPSRARISPDERWVATTFFSSGHSYDGTNFAVQTRITEIATGAMIDLSEFTILKDGESRQAPQGLMWGVTFAGGSSIYATAMFDAKPYLVRGDILTKSAEVIFGPLECPSLSPDGTRIAYKKRIAEGPTRWQVALLDLATMESRDLVAEPRSIDDQIMWLDDSRIAYLAPGRRVTTAVLDVDAGTPPGTLLDYADSPAVLG
jgi:hypothetical protein